VTLLLPAVSGTTLLGRLRIRLGVAADAERCQQIARQWRDELPVLTRVHFTDAVKPSGNRRLYVAEVDSRVVGFVRWNATGRGLNAGYNVVYDLAVDRAYHGLGIGRALLYAVPTPIRLKCTLDNAGGNRFYASAGMVLARVETHDEQGRALARPLNVWQMNVPTCLVAGGNQAFPKIARQSRMAYGVRADYTPHDWLFLVDINWRNYRWGDYLRKVRRWHPVAAMVADYEHPDQKRQLDQQIAQLQASGVLRVMVCPKFDGAVRDIPPDCVIALSVPSQYAGFLPADLSELANRRVHLLGGTPQQWLDLIPRLRGIGAQVLSVDGSSHETAAKKGTHWEAGRWVNRGKKAAYHATTVYSGLKIQAAMQQIQAKQPLLIAA
jgi:GNAT superfamily N-acetyltransferase